MATLQHNITTVLTQNLLAAGDNVSNAKYISVANVHASSTAKVDTRARARAVALKIENTAVSQNWKLGTFRLDIQPDGRR